MKLPSALEILVARQAVDIDYNLPPPDLTTLPAGSLFETWRPHIHVLPPHGQIGDPCAHYNDPATGLFHVGFLHNGTGISSVFTDDLVTYRDVNPDGGYIIVAGGPNDPLAVFDGSVIPDGIYGLPTLLYTSVTYLPIHWTLPYVPGSETQSLAVTFDGGHNFDKLPVPPVIPAPPAGIDATAFRDPYVFQNRQLDQAVDSVPDTWYAAISGGQQEVGPGVFLYRNQDPSFMDWEYIGEWWQEPANTTWGDGTWAKRWGYNFETGNAFSLDEEGYNVEGSTFMTVGVEGAYAPIEPQVTSFHAMLWAAGDVSATDSGEALFTPNMAGVLDWGRAAYAAAGKVLPHTSQASFNSGAPDRFITYVWLTGDVFGSVTGFPAEQQGWQNTLLLPRELKLQKIHNVVDNDLVHETGSWRVAKHGDEQQCIELETLGIEIARETYEAATSTPSFEEPPRELQGANIIPFEQSPASKFFVLEAQISFPQSARDSDVQSGFQILASDLESTTIYYQFSNESIVIDRQNTSAATQTTPGIDNVTEAGHLRLFDISEHCSKEKCEDHGHWEQDKSNCKPGSHEAKIETLNLTIVGDNSVLEVYANSRFALATWARPWYANSTEIRFFHNGESEVSFHNIVVHDGLYDAYPDRET
ncbi:glycosyl hydrolase [Aspergillus cavernicola]|uniref:Glycosyl hydrolase n=1 Tax=Aspergillus cavernicola TaxID=176166 RepID=A0ABR4HIU3_9EURO